MLLSEWGNVVPTPDDLQRKFAETYVLARIKDSNEEPYPIFFRQFGGDAVVAYDRRQDGGIVNRVASFNQIDVIAARPKPGMYALNEDGIALVRKIPARQWHEGMYSGNTEVLVAGGGERLRRIPFEMAEKVFAPQKDVTLSDGLRLTKPGKSCRLTQHWWLRSTGKDQMNLMRWGTRVGSWCSGLFFFSDKGKFLEQEMRDELGFNHAV